MELPLEKLDTTAEEILFLLAAEGVRVIFFHPGTDTAPLQEAVLSLHAKGLACPEVLPCAHESVGLAAAHGFWKVSRRPQAVIVHVDIGTQNLGAMLHNAQRDRAGVVVIAGRAPYTVDGSVAGGRSNHIHWLQDEPDQAGIVRNYVKWAQEITRPDMAARAVGRALQAAAATPAGPVYLMVAREVLMEPASADGRGLATPYATPQPTAMSADSLGAVTDALARARRPVVITSRAGYEVDTVPALRALAELVGVQVFGRPESVNLPWNHPLYLRDGRSAAGALAEADVVLVIDCEVPWIPRDVAPRPDALIVQIDADPVKLGMPLWSFPVNLCVQASSEVAIRQLVESLTVAAAADPALAAGWSGRRRRLEAGQPRVAAAGADDRDGDAIELPDVMRALNQVLDGSDILVDESVSARSVLHQWLDRSMPGTVISSGGPGLGWGLGAAVGAGLAAPGRRIVAVVGDGSFIFGQPIAAFMLAAEARSPFLAVVLNNRGYRASRTPVFELFPAGESARQGDAVATRFAADPDFSLIATACGAYGEKIGERRNLVPALERCLAALAGGTCAVADIALS